MKLGDYPESTGLDAYDDTSPALLFGPAGDARSMAADLIRDAGLRLADVDSIDHASSRIDQQLRVGLIWVEAAGADVPEALLERLADAATSGRAQVILSVAPGQIDAAAAAMGEGQAQILVSAGEVERASALAYALAERARPMAVQDVGTDNAVRLRQISDEMGRIAATLARLSSGADDVSRPLALAFDSRGDEPEVEADTIRAIIRARRLRARFFSEELFADPAWDMLLNLLQAEIAQHRVPVSSLCIAASVPATTALRWIKAMTDTGLFVRRADPLDARRVFVELSPGTSQAMRRYFAEVGHPSVI
jgi:DNA-binding MarR family transcriptional regulator